MQHAASPEIPLIDIGADGPLALLHAARARADDLLLTGHRHYGRPLLRIGDHLSRAWLARSGNPYHDQILAIAAAVGAPGAVMLNLSFEWSCTSGTAPDPGGVGNRMLRVLDWPLDGLGRNVVVARERAPAGVVYNVTWPGAVGVLTAMAPGRFAAAINQAPMRRHGMSLPGDWIRNRVALWRRGGLPPAHLLRKVFDMADSYGEAKAMLVGTPLALPALFTLSGIRPEEGCVIERTETAARVFESPVACANDWLSTHLDGHVRGDSNAARRHLLAQVQAGAGDGFAWVRPPILNRCTRLAVAANAALGVLAVLGFERERPVTAEFQWHHTGLEAA